MLANPEEATPLVLLERQIRSSWRIRCCERHKGPSPRRCGRGVSYARITAGRPQTASIGRDATQCGDPSLVDNGRSLRRLRC